MSLIQLKVKPESIGELLKELEAMANPGADEEQESNYCHANEGGYDDSFYGYGEDTQSEVEEPEDAGPEFRAGSHEDGEDISLTDGLKIYIDRYLTNLLNSGERLPIKDVQALWDVIYSLEDPNRYAGV